jgi:hypothetical protein
MLTLDLLFMVTWGFFPFIWVKTLKLIDLPLNQINIPIGLILFILLMQYLGIPILYFGLDDYRAEFVTDKFVVLKTWLITSSSVFLLITGFAVARIHFGKLVWRTERAGSVATLTRLQRLLVLVLGVVCLLFLAFYVKNVGFSELAISVALGYGSDSTVALARSRMANAFEGNYYWYQLFMQKILSVVFLVLFCNRLVERQGRSWTLMVFGLMLLFSLLLASEKGLVISLFLAIIFAILWTRNQGTFKKKDLTLFGFASVLVLSGMYGLFMGDSDIYATLNSIYSRTLTGGIQPAYHYVEIFPDKVPYLLGRSLPNPGGIFPFEPYLLTKEVWSLVHSGAYAEELSGSMPTIFWGDMYANFGIIGALLSPVYVGYLIYMLNAYYFKLEMTPMTIALYIWLIIHYQGLAITSLANFLVDTTAVIIAAVVLLIHRVRHSRRVA